MQGWAMTPTSMEENHLWVKILQKICGLTPVGLQYALICMRAGSGDRLS